MNKQNTQLVPPPVEEKNRNGLSTPDQSDLFDIDLNVALLTIAWGKGDEHEIQKAMDLLYDWQKRRQDRLTQKHSRAV